jgi:hypothetical protein
MIFCSFTAAAAGSVILPVTAGSADLPAHTFAVSGPGFSFTGFENGAPPVPGVPPGGQIPSFAAGFESDVGMITGNITVGNTSFNYVEDVVSHGSLSLEFSFFLTTPAVSPPSNLTLTGPFSLTLSDFVDENFQSGHVFMFSGAGTATVNLFLQDSSGVPLYGVRSIHYDFSGTSVPDPPTYLLIFLTTTASLSLRSFRKWRGTVA